MKAPDWKDESTLKDGSLWSIQCDGLWVTLHKSIYPSGWIMNCKQVYVLDYVIRNINIEDAKLIALQKTNETVSHLSQAIKRLKLAEKIQGDKVFGPNQYETTA